MSAEEVRLSRDLAPIGSSILWVPRVNAGESKVVELIASWRFRAQGEDTGEMQRALRVAARYLEALVEAGEFGQGPRCFRPGVHFDEFEPGAR